MKRAENVQALTKSWTMCLQKLNDSQLPRFSSQNNAASNTRRPASPNRFNKCANPRNNNPNPDSAIPATEVITRLSSPTRFEFSGQLCHNNRPVVKKNNQTT